MTKRPLAYITAAWCVDYDADSEQATEYCRAVYDAVFFPICSLLYLPLFLNDAIPEEHKSGIDIGRDLLRRAHVGRIEECPLEYSSHNHLKFSINIFFPKKG